VLQFKILYCIDASSDSAFAAQCLTAFACAHSGTETALTQLLDLALAMILHDISPDFWLLVSHLPASCLTSNEQQATSNVFYSSTNKTADYTYLIQYFNPKTVGWHGLACTRAWPWSLM
jgi:hypothetical protein